MKLETQEFPRIMSTYTLSLYYEKERAEMGGGGEGTTKRNRCAEPRDQMKSERAERLWLGKIKFTSPNSRAQKRDHQPRVKGDGWHKAIL